MRRISSVVFSAFSLPEIQLDPGVCTRTGRIQLLYGFWVNLAHLAIGLGFGFAAVQVPQLSRPNSEIRITRSDASWIGKCDCSKWNLCTSASPMVGAYIGRICHMDIYNCCCILCPTKYMKLSDSGFDTNFCGTCIRSYCLSFAYRHDHSTAATHRR